MNTNKVIYEIGKTTHGQPLRLEMHSGGSYSLIREAANQRDDPAYIHGLSREQIRRIGDLAHLEAGGACLIVHDLGKTPHGASVLLKMHGDGSYSLIQEAANQRDYPTYIHGLSREQIRVIGYKAHYELGIVW